MKTWLVVCLLAVASIASAQDAQQVGAYATAPNSSGVSWGIEHVPAINLWPVVAQASMHALDLVTTKRAISNGRCVELNGNYGTEHPTTGALVSANAKVIGLTIGVGIGLRLLAGHYARTGHPERARKMRQLADWQSYGSAAADGFIAAHNVAQCGW